MYQPDAQKRTQWMTALSERTEIEPEQLLGLFSPEWIRRTDQHQRSLAAISMSQLVEKPLPPAVDEPDAQLQKLALNNIGAYDDKIEDLLYEDDIVNQLLEVRQNFAGSEEYSELMRVRRTVVAHFIFASIAHENAPGAA